jgi:YD repeat-containing protein
MYRLLVLFSLVLSVFANELALVVTENDPSTFVEGVSVITGDLYSFEEDYVVQGAEPIRLRRSFVSREGGFKSYQHLTATFGCTANCFFVNEHNGTPLYYFHDPQNHLHPRIGDQFYGEKKKHWKALRYNAHDFTETAKGVANTSSGKISAQTNLKNQYIIFDPNVNEKGKSFTLYASDGTRRRYVNLEGQTPLKDFPWKGQYLIYGYKLVSETLPNGHIVHYHWNSENRVDRIYTTNAALNKTFAQVNIPVKDSQTEGTLTGSDDRSVTYKTHPTEVKDLLVFGEVISPDLPDQHFDWSVKTRKFGNEEKKMPYLQCLSLPKSRSMQIGYSDVTDPIAHQLKTDAQLKEIRARIKEIKHKAKKKPKYDQELGLLLGREKKLLKYGAENEGLYEGYLVKTISSPVGKDATVITTHSFFFDKPNKNSFVLDVNNNKTAYFWNDDYRLTRVNRFVGAEALHSSETFLWETTHLRCKFLSDHQSLPIFSLTYLYDDRGNVREESFYGNLSGKGAALSVGANGFPLENGVERFTRKYLYSEDGRNLLLKQEESHTGLITKYTYRNDCHLIETKSICDGGEVKIHHRYEYDDHILCLEIVDDRIAKILKKITPRQTGPYIGMPETIEELYGDGTLLRKTVLQYGKGGAIRQKDIYDANGKFRYSLNIDYDDKGRLKSETNAIGQRAAYQYDEVGNRTYAKDFSGRLETFYEYDFSKQRVYWTIASRVFKGGDTDFSLW